MDPNWKVSVAIHESGHAVAAALLGIPLLYVSITREEHLNAAGVCVHDRAEMRRIPRSWDCIYGAAGAAAQRLGGAADSMSAGDIAPIIRPIWKRHPKWKPRTILRRSARTIRRWRQRAMDLLRPHWGAVLALAEMLLRHGIVAGDDVLRAMENPIKKITSGLMVRSSIEGATFVVIDDPRAASPRRKRRARA